MTISTPILFGPEERSLFGWVHQPDDGLQRATAILCPPVAREYISAHDTYRVLADALAERGITAIRFDYDGTGDSAGGEDDPERMDAYLGSIGYAIDLAERLGTTELALVGMRMGALLAAGAAAACPRVTRLVLWDPCVVRTGVPAGAIRPLPAPLRQVPPGERWHRDTGLRPVATVG